VFNENNEYSIIILLLFLKTMNIIMFKNDIILKPLDIYNYICVKEKIAVAAAAAN